jgi:hypothetical protein
MPETIRVNAAALHELREALRMANGAGIAMMVGEVGTEPGLRAIAGALRAAVVAVEHLTSEDVAYRA